MTKYERFRLILTVINIVITLGLPFIVIHVNAQLNHNNPCKVK